jgi:intracellular septation protein A
VILRREPALFSALAASVIQLVAAFFVPLSVDQQGILNAVVVAILGLATTIMLKSDGISAAALGLVKALIALGIAFGLAWSPEQQAVAMSLAAALSAMFVRTQEVAPVPAVVREPHVVD